MTHVTAVVVVYAKGFTDPRLKISLLSILQQGMTQHKGNA